MSLWVPNLTPNHCRQPSAASRCLTAGTPKQIASSAIDQMATTQLCANPGCGKPGPLHCSRCKTTSYCSQNCQTAHWNEHKGPCKCKARAEVLAAVGPKKSDPSTVYLALDALKTHDSAAVTEMMSAAVLSVVFLGARDDMEGEMDFKTLFALMKVLFPSTTQLKVCLVGPETGQTLPQRVQRRPPPGQPNELPAVLRSWQPFEPAHAPAPLLSQR